jgi:hypothetical protein
MAEDVAVEMHHAALPARVGQIVGDAFDEATARVRDDQLHAAQAPVDQVAQEGRPAGLVLLGALADAEDLAVALGIDGARHQQRDVAHLARPGPLHDDPVEVEVGMLALDRPVPPFLDLGVDLLVEVRHRAGLTRVPHSASVMSSTRRTDTPARYISISASSTELSRRR